MYIYIFECIYPHTHIHVVLIHQVAARGISALSPQSYFSRSLFYSVVFTHTHTHQESYFRRDGVRDMFYPFSMNPAEVDTHCYWKYGVWPRRSWITQLYGECVPENERKCECMRARDRASVRARDSERERQRQRQLSRSHTHICDMTHMCDMMCDMTHVCVT